MSAVKSWIKLSWVIVRSYFEKPKKQKKEGKISRDIEVGVLRTIPGNIGLIDEFINLICMCPCIVTGVISLHNVATL